jgi:hypothetical protein
VRRKRRGGSETGRAGSRKMADSLNMYRTVSIVVWNAFEYVTGKDISLKERKKRKSRGNYDDMRRCTLVVCLVVMTVSWESMIKLTFDSDNGVRLAKRCC